jgi:hypothetical protein
MPSSAARKGTRRIKMAMPARFKRLKVTRHHVEAMPVEGKVQTSLAATLPVCPLCGSRAADTKVSIGPVSVEICSECSKPLWHGLGLAQWAKKFFK